jgi:maltose alpha-D-glucosyltransferase/alpha-amylase
MLAVRHRHPAFGRGTVTLLYPKNRKILAYLREYQGDTLLCVVNVAHSPQAVELDLSQFAGRVPVELNAGTLFPPIGDLTYLLTLPPYGFYWFALARETDWPSWHTPAPEPLPEFVTIIMRENLANALATSGRDLVENESLRQYLVKRRWFGWKDQTIKTARIDNLTNISRAGEREILLAEIEVESNTATSRWFLPLGVLWEDEPSAALPSRLALARVRRRGRIGLLTDGFALSDFVHTFITALAAGREFENEQGVVRFRPTSLGLELLREMPHTEINWLAAEQSNSSLTVGDVALIKIFRRIREGEHPEAEMSRYLTAAGFANAPPLLGEVVQVSKAGISHTLAVILGFVRNQGDAWSWVLDHLKRALHSLASDSESDILTDCEAIAAAIGRRLGEMHRVLAQQTPDAAFAPEIADDQSAAGWARKTEERLEKAFAIIEQTHEWSTELDRERASALLKARGKLATAVRNLAKAGVGTLMTRIHGDFHLGQALVASGEAFIIDFEGEPAASIGERRAKSSPLRDVAGLLRSIDYAGAALREGKGAAAAPIEEAKRNRVIDEFRRRAARAFLKEYWAVRGTARSAPERALLGLFLIEKAAYEIAYEAANRPTWIGVPLAGLARLSRRIPDSEGARDE